MKISKLLRRVETTPAFWLFLCAYYYFDPAGTFAAFLFSVSLHEAGHLLALKLCKVPIHKLRLSATGAELQTPPLSYRQTLIVAAAGPTVNFLLLLFLLHRAPEAALLNFGLLFYNLLPFYPLDGGQLLWALLHLILNDHAACMTQWMICLVCGVGLLVGSCLLTCVWHAGLWPVLLCAILLTRVSFPAFSYSVSFKKIANL